MPTSKKPALLVPSLALLSLIAAVLAGCSSSSSISSTGGTTTPPTPDFSLAATPATLSVTAGTTGSASLLATSSGGFTATVAVTVGSLPSGVTATPSPATLTPGTAQAVSLAASKQTTPGTYTITFTGVSGAISHSASVSLNIAAASAPASTVDVTTYHYDNARDGLNAQETILTPANVNSASFGLVANYPVDGKVDAEPLYVSNVTLSGRSANILYAATEHGTVFAFDTATGSAVWQMSILGAGETTSDDHGCNQISPEIGITSTPVIDRNIGPHGTIFIIGMSKDTSGKYHQRLHALDLATGAELSGGPTEIAATYPGGGDNSTSGSVIFDPGQYAERVGLLLLNGTIYTAWTSHCDIRPYTGWVMGFDETTIKSSTVLNLTPNGNEGAVWMSGFGLAADASANIYLLDANGLLDTGFTSAGFPSHADYGNAMLKLSTTSGLAVADYFEPYNTLAESNADIDLGSGGAMLLPDLTDASGKTRHLVVGAGKDTNIYLADRDNMGKFNAANNTNLYQELPNALPAGAWSGPAFFNNTLYYGGQNDVLKAFPVANALLATVPASASSATFPYPGTTPGISANGTKNGIVWAIESSLGAPGVLHAYDPTNLANELYNSNQAGTRDAFGNGNKFITPMIANGRVYIGTQNSVAVFGLLKP